MGHNESIETSQIQKMINKQEIALKQDQHASNSIMSKILSELENLVIFCGYKGTTKFNYYATKGQTKDEIINQIVYQLTIFYSSYKNFLKHNPQKKYEYPDNFTYQNIIDLVSDWKKFLKNSKSNSSLEKYYNSFLKILEGKNLDKYILNEFDNLDKDSKPITKEDLGRVMNAGSIATSVINDKNKEIKKNMMEKGDYKVKIVIGGKREDNRFYQQFEKNEENLKKEKKELFNIFYAAIGYLELYYQVNIDNKFKYFDYIKKDIKKELLQKYEQSKDEFIKKINNINQYYEYNFFKERKVNQVESDLEKWKFQLNKNSQFKNVIKEIDNAINVFCKGKEDSIA